LVVQLKENGTFAGFYKQKVTKVPFFASWGIPIFDLGRE
jgi:hypothetical protein